MTWWMQFLLGAGLTGSVILLNSIAQTLEAIHRSIDLARSEADNHHDRLLQHLYASRQGSMDDS